MTRHLLTYAGTFIALAVLDFLWLGVIARSWYRDGIGHLMAGTPNWGAAAAFYLLYPVGLVIFAVLPSGGVVSALGASAGAWVLRWIVASWQGPARAPRRGCRCGA